MLTNDKKSFDNFTIEYLFDSSEKMTIKEISHTTFKKKIQNKFAFGYQKGNSWFKITVKNLSDKKRFVLSLDEALFETVDFYEYDNIHWKRTYNGFSVPLEEKSIESIKPSYLINLDYDESKTYYIKTYTKFPSLGKFQIFAYETFFLDYAKIHPLYLLFFGILFVVIIFSLFLYLRFKESIYIYYVGYTFFFAFFVSLFSGFILYFGLENLHYELHFVPAVSIVFLILFSNKFLSINESLPLLYKVLKICAVILFLLALLIIVQVEPWFEIMNIFVIFVLILLILASVFRLKQGNKKSVYYLFAILIYMITIIVLAVMANGWIEYSEFRRYSYLYASCFEIIFFALMLINRFHMSQNEKIRISNELLEIKEKNEFYLKEEVVNRTTEVQEMNNILFDIVQDKELLLKELYHRVKNNFQMVISLLWIEFNKLKDKEQKEDFSHLINRIKSMSLMHDYLYNSNGLSNIKSDEYILNIIDEVNKIYDNSTFTINSNLSDVDISINDAMLLGMVINEVLNNSIKHHKDKDSCIITLYFKKYDNKYLLSIQDNGDGFDEQEIHSGLGMGLIKQFVNKLKNAEFLFINNHGTRFELSFEA